MRTPRVLCRDVSSITPTLDGDIKVFHWRAKPAETHFMPGRAVDYWGFNGSMLGPTIEVNAGSRLRVIVENGLPDVFSMPWHGLEVPIEMDGVPGLTQDPIQPGGSFVYEFTVHQHGTYFYHSHMAMQEMMGTMTLVRVLEPRVFDEIQAEIAATAEVL